MNRHAISIAVAALGVSLATGSMPAAAAPQATVTPVQPSTARPAPPRDTERKDVKGTAVLKGRVVAGESGKPLRRARITIRAPELGSESQRTTSTNLDGRYEFKELPAARYRVSVTRGGYLGLDHGQRRPGEIGRPVQLADGQVLDKIDFALPRMSTITGRVTDESGEPIEGVRIFATRMMFFEGRRRLVPIGTSHILPTTRASIAFHGSRPATTTSWRRRRRRGRSRRTGRIGRSGICRRTSPGQRRRRKPAGSRWPSVKPPAPSTSRSCPDGQQRYPAQPSTRASVRSHGSA